MLSFRNQVVLITGASRGVGATTVVKFAEAGEAGVIINYRANRDAALTVAEAVERAGARPLLVLADASRAEQEQALVRQIVDRFGRLDVMVANAGLWPTESRAIATFGDAKWDGLIFSETYKARNIHWQKARRGADVSSQVIGSPFVYWRIATLCDAIIKTYLRALWNSHLFRSSSH